MGRGRLPVNATIVRRRRRHRRADATTTGVETLSPSKLPARRVLFEPIQPVAKRIETRERQTAVFELGPKELPV